MNTAPTNAVPAKRGRPVGSKNKVKRKVGRPRKQVLGLDEMTGITDAQMHELVYAVTSGKSIHDPIRNPAHYTVGGIETIDFIEAKQLNYNLGNVVKYITRADHKGNRMEDLKKAVWYLTREIQTTTNK